MLLEEVDARYYKSVFAKSFSVFHSIEFNELNKSKADQVYYFLFKSSKYKLGLIGGVRDNVFNSPFSAPFGGFDFVGSFSPSDVKDAITELIKFLRSKGIEKIKITLPPDYYNPSPLAKIMNGLHLSTFDLKLVDLSNYFLLSDLNDVAYEQLLLSKPRKSYIQAMDQDISFDKVEDIQGKEEVYNVIKINRAENGYPLRLSFDELRNTTDIINSDFFKLSINGIVAAAAINFYVSESIVQIIYWGHIAEYGKQLPMNALAGFTFDYYNHKKGIEMVDIGPSTENGIPNEGLLKFKENIGCRTGAKFTFEKVI